MTQMPSMTKNLRLALHGELNPAQQQRAAQIYLDERNWGPILQADLKSRGYNHSSLEDHVNIIADDARQRDAIFPSGQLVLLANEEVQEAQEGIRIVKEGVQEIVQETKKEVPKLKTENWKPIGSIHTVVSNDEQVQATFHQPDTWNVFTNYGRLLPERYVPEGNRWVCFAIQTDQDLDKVKWKIKPADLIIKGVRLLAFAEPRDYELLTKDIELSAEVQKAVGSHPTVQYINPLTRLSGFHLCKESFPQLLPADYTRNLEKLVLTTQPLITKFEQVIQQVTKKCALRYHLSRGARIEQVIDNFRVHDQQSEGYGASVLYSR